MNYTSAVEVPKNDTKVIVEIWEFCHCRIYIKQLVCYKYHTLEDS